MSVQEDEGASGPEGGADPKCRIDDEVNSTSHRGRNEFIDSRIDGCVFATDSGSCKNTKHEETPDIPGERSGGSGRQIQSEGDEEQLLASQAVCKQPKKRAPITPPIR